MKRLFLVIFCCLLTLGTFVLPREVLAAPNSVIEVRNPALEFFPSESMWAVSADFKFELPPKLEEAIQRGVELHFLLDFELRKPRWYWFDDTPIQKNLNYRLYYHALTRQYRLSFGVLESKFSTLKEALDSLRKVNRWRVFDVKDIATGETYVAAMRMRLDTSQLSKPIHISMLTNKDWQLTSVWRMFTFKAQ